MPVNAGPIQVTFEPAGRHVAVSRGTSLLEAARQADVALAADCGGQGLCGKCRVIVRQGRVHTDVSLQVDEDEVRSDLVLACRAVPQTDAIVVVPPADQVQDASRLSRLMRVAESAPLAPDPLVRKVAVTLAPASVAESLSELQRLERALADQLDGQSLLPDVEALRRLGRALRSGTDRITATLAWRVGRWRLIDVEAGHQAERQVGAAVDIGTTTIVAHLVDLVTGETLDGEARLNSQRVHGADYITRIIAVEKSVPLEEMQRLVVEDINQLLETMTRRQGLSRSDVLLVVAAGNEPMIHFLIGLDPTAIRRSPYVGVADTPRSFFASEVGLAVADRALVYPLPGVAAFVGGDITAGVQVTRLHQRERLGLLVDVGTNGEVVVGNREWLACASSSAGTAFEAMRFGMRAIPGAIERVWCDRRCQVRWKVIGGGKPQGICGSGVVDLIAELFRIGVLGRDGKFRADSPCRRLRRGEDEWEFVLATAEESADGQPIVLGQSELQNVIRSKAGVAAAITILLETFGVGPADLDVIFLAGSFGNFIDVRHAIRIGLLPEVDPGRIQYVGNTSLMGAKMVLRRRAALEEIRQLAGRMTYVDLMNNPRYMDEFIQANFLPHTDVSRYPRVMAELGREPGLTAAGPMDCPPVCEGRP